MVDHKAFIFDIDGTLTDDNSWIALTREMCADVAEHNRINDEFITDKLQLDEATRHLADLWKGTGKANKSFITQIFASIPVLDQAASTVEYLKKKGYLICLITGSFDLYAERVANELNVSDYFANSRFEWEDNGKLRSFVYYPDQSGQKLLHLKEFCKKHSLQVTECVSVGDDYNDIKIFKETQHGISVSSKRIPELEAVAWKKINSLEDLRELF